VISDAALPQVRLSPSQSLRLAVAGVLVALALVRVVPDFVRFVYPLHFFGYRTDADAVVTFTAPRTPAEPSAIARAVGAVRARFHGRHAAATPPPAADWGDPIYRGDRVRIDRIKPFDRKLGIAGRAFTYDNPVRYLPIERNGREMVLRLNARTESAEVRFTDMLRIVLCIVAACLGAMLFIVRPSIATAAFFVFSLAGIDAPATYLDTTIPQPWRPVLPWIDDTIHGAVRPALLLFALCLIDGDADAPRERVFAWITGALAVGLGTLNAYVQWALNYGAVPAEQAASAYRIASYGVAAACAAAFTVAFVRARRNDRHRISWIAAAFLFAGAARLLSDAFYPGRIVFWENNLLVSAAIVPIVAIWVAVLRHQFFNVDFVVNRAIVYVALSAAFVTGFGLIEEVATYVFYSNTDLAYVVLSVLFTGVGLVTSRVYDFLQHLVDRFIFRERMQQRQALEFIAGYILDAETVEDVYRALLQDAAHALQLSFGGILARQPDGGYALAQSFNWPEDFTFKLGPSDELTRAIAHTRGALTFSGKDTRMIQQSFPNERLTFAAPIFFDRSVSGIVVYGHNVSGLDLDPDEREHLVRVVAHASIALNTIELNRYRHSDQPATLPSPEPA
jgi:hypothetical protein